MWHEQKNIITGTQEMVQREVDNRIKIKKSKTCWKQQNTTRKNVKILSGERQCNHLLKTT